MRWPWRRGETRSYTSIIQDAALATAEHGDSGSRQTAALETAAGLYSRAFGAAAITSAPASAADDIATLLAAVGRDLVRQGESVWRIHVADGRMRFAPTSSHEVRGGWDPSTWRYTLDMSGPDRTASVNLPAESVLHFRFAVDSKRPWQGRSPLSWAAITGSMHGKTERYHEREAALPHGVIAPVGDPQAPHLAPGEAVKQGIWTGINTTLPDKGGIGVVPADQWRGRNMGGNPFIHYGPAPGEDMLALRTQSALDVLAACGVPASLVVASADGTGQREAWRRFVLASVVPLARSVTTELRVKLDSPMLTLGFSSLYGHDLSRQSASPGRTGHGGRPIGRSTDHRRTRGRRRHLSPAVWHRANPLEGARDAWGSFENTIPDRL